MSHCCLTFSAWFCFGAGAKPCPDRSRCLQLDRVLWKLFCFTCRSQAGRKTNWWGTLRGDCLILLLELGSKIPLGHLVFKRWETLFSEPQESFCPRCFSPWPVFVFLVASQHHVAGEGFNPEGPTYEPLLSSSTKACLLCASPRSEAEIRAVPSECPVSLLSTRKALAGGQETSPPLYSPQAGGEGVPTVRKPIPNQVRFERQAPSWLPDAMLGHLCFCLFCGFFCVGFFFGEERLILVSSLTGGNPEWNYCVAWGWGWGWRPRSSPEHFLMTKWGLLVGSCGTSWPVIHETRNLTEFRLQLALGSRTPRKKALPLN